MRAMAYEKRSRSYSYHYKQITEVSYLKNVTNITIILSASFPCRCSGHFLTCGPHVSGYEFSLAPYQEMFASLRSVNLATFHAFVMKRALIRVKLVANIVSQKRSRDQPLNVLKYHNVNLWNLLPL